MKKHIAGAVAAAALVAAPIAWATTAGAGSPSSYALTPQSGPAGTVVTATGNNCPATGYVVNVYWPIDLPPGYLIINEPATPNEDGTFSTQATVPADAEPGTYEIGVQCVTTEGGGQATQFFSFDVTEAPTTTTTPPSTTPGPTVAAEGVAAAPAFTG